MPKTNKNSLLRNIRINKLFLIALTLFLLYIVSAFAATNVSVLYGWNGSATVPVQVDSAGRLKTTLNLSKSTGIGPESDNAYDLGTTALRWRTGHIIDLVSAGNIYAVGLNASSINITGNAYFATSSGKVGIGATSPNTTFHVSGTANITGTLSVGSFEISNAGVGSMNVTGRTLLGLNGIESSVGVSTLSPLSRFHVNDSSAIGAFRVTNVSGTTLFFINGSSGKIGVRTTNIDTEFKVAGNVNITDTLWVNNENVTAPTNVSLNYVYDGSQFVGAKATSAGIMQLDVVSQSADKALDTFTVTNDLVVDTNTLVVNATDNRVGIVTAAPNDALEVVGNLRVSGSINASLINATKLRINNTLFVNDSRVGIGVSDPLSNLHILNGDIAVASAFTGTLLTLENDASAYINILTPSNKVGGLIIGDTTSNRTGELSYNNNENRWQVFMEGANRLLYYPGNFTFQEATNISTLSGNLNLMPAGGDGNVGIGTDSPTKELHVIGDANISNTLFLGGNLTFGNTSDYAEMFESDVQLEKADVVCLDEYKKIDKCTARADPSVIGVVSTNPSIIGRTGFEKAYPVGLLGVVPTKVIGPIDRFSMLTTSYRKGYAEQATRDDFGAIIGKAMEECYKDECVIDVVVNLQ